MKQKDLGWKTSWWGIPIVLLPSFDLLLHLKSLLANHELELLPLSDGRGSDLFRLHCVRIMHAVPNQRSLKNQARKKILNIWESLWTHVCSIGQRNTLQLSTAAASLTLLLYCWRTFFWEWYLNFSHFLHIRLKSFHLNDVIWLVKS